MKKSVMQRDIETLRYALKGVLSVGDSSLDRPRVRGVAVEALRRTDRHERPISRASGSSHEAPKA